MASATWVECFGFSGTKEEQQQSKTDSRAKRQSGRKTVPLCSLALFVDV